MLGTAVITWDMIYVELIKILIVYLLVTIVCLFALILGLFHWSIQRFMFGKDVDDWFSQSVDQLMSWWINCLPMFGVLFVLILLLQRLGFFLK